MQRCLVARRAMITSARGIRSSTVKKLKQQIMAGSNVPASSFRVSRPGKKRPVIVANFPGQQQPSDADKSSSHVLPSLPRTAHAAVSRPRVAAEIGLSRPAEDGGVGGSAGPSQDETRLLESPCKSRAPGASGGEDSGVYRETADTTVDAVKETSSLTDRCRVGATEEIELDSTTDPLPSPNAFVSLRISSPSIHSGLEEVQRSMVEKDRAVKGVLTSLDKLHVTLSIIRLENKEEERRYVL